MSGAERIAEAFAAARAEGRAALMPYMMAGFPEAATSAAVADVYAEHADLIEFGVPFSDPLADGPVIHAAATRSLAAGTTFASALELAAAIAPRVPVVAMVYANMVVSRGAGAFAQALAEAGLCGVIVPDLPPEEAGELRAELGRRGLAFVPLVAPTTPPARRRAICAEAEGFVYVVSDTRTTGEREELPPALGELVGAVRADAPVPAAVGFGISTPEQVATAGRIADGVIVGSRLVRAVAEADGSRSAAQACRDFLVDAREALVARAIR
jgi:tryptophan synthase alpha chain